MRPKMIQAAQTALACFFIFFTALPALNAAEPGTKVEGLLKRMLSAVEANDYETFVSDGNATFKAALTKQVLEGVSALLSPRMKKGYETVYLGVLNQQGCQVHLWKVAYKDGGDDTLAKLVLKDGKVAGFWLQ